MRTPILLALLLPMLMLSACSSDSPLAHRWQLTNLETTPPITPEAARYISTLYEQAFLEIRTDGTFVSTMEVILGNPRQFEGRWNVTEGGTKLSLETPGTGAPAEYIVEVADGTRLVLKADKARMEFRRAD